MRQGGRCIDLPAAFQRAGREMLSLPGATRQNHAQHAARFRRQLQPAAGGQVHGAVRFADHRTQFRAAQSFLHRPEHVGPVRAADDDQALRVEPEGGQPRPVQVGAGTGIDAPQHRAGDPPGQHRRKAAGGAAAQFMHRAPGQAALRQAGIDVGQAEGAACGFGRVIAPLDGRDIGAKFLDDRRTGHVPSLSNVLILFYSFDGNRVKRHGITDV